MPGKCKFQDAWLEKDMYRDWLMRDVHDIHSALCRACCKFIKLQTMGEAALTSHAGGAGHKAAVCKLQAQSLYMSQSSQNIKKSPGDEGTTPPYLPCETGHINGSIAQVKRTIWPEEEKRRPGLSQIEEVKALPSESEWSELNHNKNSISYNPEFQDSSFTTFISATGSCTRRPTRRGRPPSKPESEAGAAASLSPLEHQRNMALLEWEGRMRSLSQEHELLAEKRRATRQKERAYRLKKKYYRAKLRRLGEDVASSSDSEQDEGHKLVISNTHSGILHDTDCRM
ncbi:unnamed protein product [Knipowitschia caucasica]|uniref:Uncharacterized protein n=1 Tax=Knipowitschia caucasica TaxID=637954 RepID=A0AAV2LXU5_KNICA